MTTPSRSAAIAAELRDEILRGQYRSGERLPSERDLAERFEVHRSAVREALKQLEQLGLAIIRPGGARAAPLEEASLDVVRHLLDLEDPPNLEIVDQVLETMSGLFGMAARLCAERASDEQRAEIRALIARLGEPATNARDQIALVHELGDHFVEASGNMVLKLVRRGVKAHVFEKLQARQPEQVPPLRIDPPILASLKRAIDEHDGSAAADAIYHLSMAIRRHALETISAELRARSEAEAREGALERKSP